MKTKRKRKASENLDDDDEKDKEISEITSKSHHFHKKFGKYVMCYFTPNETVPFDDLTAISMKSMKFTPIFANN